MSRLAHRRTCLFCGRREHIEVTEFWESGEFLLDACCNEYHASVCEFLEDNPKAGAKWLAALRDGVSDLELPPADPLDVDGEDADFSEPTFSEIAGHSIRRVVANDGQLLLDFDLRIEPVSWQQAKSFVDRFHKHCEPPSGWRFGAAIRNGYQTIGVVTVGRPVARAFDHTKIVEVNRLAVRRDVAPALVWNGCSMLYGWAAREARKRGFERIVTYTLESEPGTTLRAAGWQPEATVRARKRGWSTLTRPRDASRTPNVNKTRWARDLRA
jgi:hypothetical protein